MARNHYLTSVDVAEIFNTPFRILIVSGNSFRGLKRIWHNLKEDRSWYTLELNSTEVGIYHDIRAVCDAYNDL